MDFNFAKHIHTEYVDAPRVADSSRGSIGEKIHKVVY